MAVFNYFKEKLLAIKHRLKDKNIDSVLWIVNLVPSLAGFSLHEEKVRFLTPFWIIHLSMLFYVYGVGNVDYQLYYANGFTDFTKSYVNISLLVLISNNSYWFLTTRPLLRLVLKEMKQSDIMAKGSPEFRNKHEKMIGNIKKIVWCVYLVNITNAVSVYIPHRIDVNGEFAMTPCVGIRPLSTSPRREICSTILGLQELSIMVVVLNWQTLFLLLIDHTTAMYHLLAEEIMTFNRPEVDNDVVRQKLPTILQRHVLILGVIQKLKLLYSMPIGINFGSNAVCISLFFLMPLDEWLGFMPIVVYCFLVFFLYCFLCQRLKNAAETFERAVYCCGWDRFDVKIQKIIYLMLIQAQEKVEILAADIIPVNIYTFATTIQFMYKFVTVMKL